MENIIEIKDLTFSYKNNLVFDKLNLEIKKGTFTTIIGENNSGKSTLSNILIGLIKTDSYIRIDNTDIKYLDKNILGYIPNNINDSILMDTVIDEIMLNNNNINNEELDELLKEYRLYDKKLENPKNLSSGEQQLMYIVSCLIKHPKIIICDETFSMLDNFIKDKILKHLKKINKENKITIINITNDIEDILYGENVVVLSDHKVLFNDKKEILYDEKLLKKLNFKIPFMVDLSLKLKYYNLLNTVETDMNRMIKKIWN